MLSGHSRNCSLCIRVKANKEKEKENYGNDINWQTKQQCNDTIISNVLSSLNDILPGWLPSACSSCVAIVASTTATMASATV